MVLQPEKRPHALTPLVWCAFHTDENSCEEFAARRVEGMAFCDYHAEKVEKALEDSGVELIPDGG